MFAILGCFPNPCSERASSKLSRRWLLIGVFALAVAGLYSLTLVVGRAPVFSNNAEIQRIFKDALVVHVDLSVLVWFLAIACMWWSMATRNARSVIPYVEEAAQICMGLSVLLMMVSPFTSGAQPFMSNYIPMISSPIFMLALGLLLCSVGLMVAKQLTVASGQWPETSAGCIALIAMVCFLWSYHLMPPVIEGEQYFDMVFWGGGHVLQLLHTQMLMLVWLFISGQHPRKWHLLFTLNLLVALLSPLAYLLYDVESSEFHQFFTHKMIALGGVAPGILSVMLLHRAWQDRAARHGDERALWACAVVSGLLFLYGGALGLMIRGQNVVIPAHYHGSIVAITLAFMGCAYAMLPRLGYRPCAHTKLAYWQPMIYALGQVMHISGLAYSGGYGVLRKTAGGVDALAPNVKIALGVMGMGGLLAIIGGLLFVVVVWRSVRQ